MKVKSICRVCGKTSKQDKSVKGRVQSCPHCHTSGTFLFDAMEAPKKRAPRKKSANKPKQVVKETVNDVT